MVRTCCVGALLVASVGGAAQVDSGAAVAGTVRTSWAAGGAAPANGSGAWNAGEGVLLDGMTAHWFATADGRDFAYVRAAADSFVGEDGSVRIAGLGNGANGAQAAAELGRSLSMLYRVTRGPKYQRAARFLRDGLVAQGQTIGRPGGVDFTGVPAAGAFLAAYAATFQELGDFDAAVKQLLLIDSTRRELETGLLREGAGSGKGSAEGGSALTNGLYAMALTDALDFLPAGHAERRDLLEALNRSAAAAMAYQDRGSGMWWKVMDGAGKAGNAPDLGESELLTYALAKRVRRGYLAGSYLEIAKRGWDGIQKSFGPGGASAAVGVAGATDGASDRGKTGAYLLAASEMAQSGTMFLGQGRTAMIDGWFNPGGGAPKSSGGRWADDSDDGFAFFGRALGRYGIQLRDGTEAPTAGVLKGVDAYVFATSGAAPAHPMDAASAAAIQAWVEAGGVLVLIADDASGSRLDQLNSLGDRFGIHLAQGDRTKVEGEHYEQGRVVTSAGGTNVFTKAHTVYMGHACTIQVSRGASKVVVDKGDVLMATAAASSGTVLALADPWVKNEWMDGRRLPPEYDAYAAGLDLAGWLLKQMH